MSEMTDQQLFLKVAKYAAGAVAGFAIFIAALGSFFTVAEFERAVVTRFGEYNRIASPGLNFKLPFVDAAHRYRTDVSALTTPVTKENPKGANTYTIDTQEVDVIYTVLYRVPVDRIEHVYKNVQDYEGRLAAMALERLKAEMGKINTEHVAENRGKIRDAIKSTLAVDAAALGVEVMDFQLTNIEFSAGFRGAVESAATAKAGEDRCLRAGAPPRRGS